MAETLWVARDEGGELYLYAEQPEWEDGLWMMSMDSVIVDATVRVNPDWFPDLKPGECRRVTPVTLAMEARDG